MTMNSRNCLDVHHHILPPDYVNVFGRRLDWSVQQAIDLMDANGISCALTSISTSVDVPDNPSETAKLARACNDYAAYLSRDHPGRFGMFAALPMHSMDAAIREVDYAFDTLASDGVGLMTNYNDKHLGDPAFDPLLAHLNRRKAVVFVHPTNCSCTLGHPDMPVSMLEFPFDTTRTIVSLLYAGVFTRYKDIRFIFCHGGGTIPFLTYRVDMRLRRDALDEQREPLDIRAALSGMYFDVTTAVSPPMIQALLDIVPVEHLLLGTDYPFVPPWRIEAAMTELAELGFKDEEREKIEFGNACALFPRLRSELANLDI